MIIYKPSVYFNPLTQALLCSFFTLRVQGVDKTLFSFVYYSNYIATLK